MLIICLSLDVLLNVQTALSGLQPSKSKPAFPMLILPEDWNNSKKDESKPNKKIYMKIIRYNIMFV